MEVTPLYSADGLRRVVVFTNTDGTFGFREEAWSSEPLEQAWVPRLSPKSHCANTELAIREAGGRISWLADALSGGKSP